MNLKLIIGDKTLPIVLPDSLNEMNLKQVLAYAEFYGTDITFDQAVNFVFCCLGLSIKIFKRIPPEDLHQLIVVNDYIKVVSEQILTLQKLPRKKNLFGPADNFENITGLEYTVADIHFTNWCESKSTEQLDLLIATLYRPRKGISITSNTNGDRRVKFNVSTYTNSLSQIKKWSFVEKQLVALYYSGNREQLSRMYKAVFFSKGSKKKKVTSPNDNFQTIMMSIAEQGVFGDLDKVESEYIHNIYKYLEMKAIEAENTENIN